MIKFRTVLRVAVLACALAAPLASASADPIIPLPAGTTYWYDGHSGQLVGYMIVECDGTKIGPYGWMTIYEEFEPLNC